MLARISFPRRAHALTCGLTLVCVLTIQIKAEPVKSHPRLLFRANQLAELRSRITPGNPVWVAFKEGVVDEALRAWKCSSTQVLVLVHDPAMPENDYLDWRRTSFTDEHGVLHLPGDSDWSTYESSSERPAVPEDDDGDYTGNPRLFTQQYGMVFAFMARMLHEVPGQEAQRLEYLAAARECLFKVVDCC